MANPYALKSPDGVERWWACGVCHFTGTYGNQGRVWRESDAEHSRFLAERCCTCRECGVVFGHGAEVRRWSNLCARCDAACEERRAAEGAARDAKAAEARAVVEATDEEERWGFLLGTPPAAGAEDTREFVDVAVRELFAIYSVATCSVDGRGYSYESRGDTDVVVAGLQSEVAKSTGLLVTPLTPSMREALVASRGEGAGAGDSDG